MEITDQANENDSPVSDAQLSSASSERSSSAKSSEQGSYLPINGAAQLKL
jgi:hypothetical protein